MPHNNDPQIRKAEIAASKIITEYGISSPEGIRLRDIAYDQGVTVIEASLASADASLVSNGQKGIIRVNSSENRNSRKRFSIAHELGHFILKHGHAMYMICNSNELNSWYSNNEETQANAFAAELLLPQNILSPYCDVDVSDISFDLINKIARDFRTSLTATAIRFVRYCPEPCALVYSRDNKILWSWRSDEWWPFIPSKKTLEKDTLAHLFFHNKEIPHEPIEVPGYSWIQGKSPEYILEHSIGSYHLGIVLSLLWIQQ